MTLKITRIRSINIKYMICMICEAELATVRLRIEANPVLTINPCLCDRCSALAVEIIYEHFMTRRPRNEAKNHHRKMAKQHPRL